MLEPFLLPITSLDSSNKILAGGGGGDYSFKVKRATIFDFPISNNDTSLRCVTVGVARNTFEAGLMRSTMSKQRALSLECWSNVFQPSLR